MDEKTITAYWGTPIEWSFNVPNAAPLPGEFNFQSVLQPSEVLITDKQ